MKKIRKCRKLFNEINLLYILRYEKIRKLNVLHRKIVKYKKAHRKAHLNMINNFK